ncbi:MAG TPA: hypothetical protein VG710_03730 [Opitutus sp.]|nr:hypothetical protein [Opitutus sp.]
MREQAVAAILAAGDSGRRELLELFDALTRNPGQRGTEQVIDETGRTNEVTYTAHFRVTCWPDHATKEVRIVDIRRY